MPGTGTRRGPVGDGVVGAGVVGAGVGDTGAGGGAGAGAAGRGVGVTGRGAGVAGRGLGVTGRGAGVAGRGLGVAGRGAGVAGRGLGVAGRGAGVGRGLGEGVCGRGCSNPGGRIDSWPAPGTAMGKVSTIAVPPTSIAQPRRWCLFACLSSLSVTRNPCFCRCWRICRFPLEGRRVPVQWGRNTASSRPIFASPVLPR